MYRRLPFLAGVCLLSACATNPIPEGYSGPLALINDTAVSESGVKASLFFVDKVNGDEIENALGQTISANSGQGFSLTPVATSRQVPAQTLTLTLVGKTHYAAPVIAMVNKTYSVSGDVTLTAQPETAYVVKGLLGDYSAVWVEEVASGKIVTSKVEKRP